MRKLFSAVTFSVLVMTSINVSAAVDAHPAAAIQLAAAEKLDINTATEQQLSALPGIGEVRAAAIVKNRPYKAKDDLVKKEIIPQAVYNKIKENIIAKQAR